MIVRQAAHVLDLLEYFAERGQPATLAEIAARFGWPRSSAFNLISTLVERGFLYEPRPRKGFYPTPRWLALAQDIAAAEPLPAAVLALLAELAEESGETVWISAQSGQQAVMLSVIQSPQPVRYMAEPGRRVPLHATASGQAILSQMSPAQAGALLRKAEFRRHGPGTPMSIAEVQDSIRRSLAQGWFESASAYSLDLGGVAVPLVIGGRIFAATVAGPLFRVADRRAQIAGMIHRAVARHLGPDHFGRAVTNLHRLDTAPALTQPRAGS